MRSFDDSIAIARVDWWQPLRPGAGALNEGAQSSMLTAATLEDWVWQTIDGIAGAAGVKAEEEEDEEASTPDDSEHLVSMVSSITFSSS